MRLVETSALAIGCAVLVFGGMAIAAAPKKSVDTEQNLGEWGKAMRTNKAFMLRYNSAQLCILKAGRAIASKQGGNVGEIDKLIAGAQVTVGPKPLECSGPEMSAYAECFEAMQVDPSERSMKSKPCVRVKDLLTFGFLENAEG